MFINKEPKNIFKTLSEGCDKNCRFQQIGPSTVTAVYYAPVYDKEGNNLNPDGNTETSSYHCTECGKSWRVMSRLGENSILLLNEGKEKKTSDYSHNQLIDIEYLKDHY